MANTEPEIQVSHNGPYIVSNVSKLKNSKGKQLETKPVMELCRCGHSNNKPYCDGIHGKVGFTDDKN